MGERNKKRRTQRSKPFWLKVKKYLASHGAKLIYLVPLLLLAMDGSIFRTLKNSYESFIRKSKLFSTSSLMMVVMFMVCFFIYSERIQINEERKELLVERYQLIEDRKQLLTARNQFVFEQNQSRLYQSKCMDLIYDERRELKGERTQLRDERNQLLGERNMFLLERQHMRKEQDQLIEARNQLMAERDQLLTERQQLHEERDQMIISWKELHELLKELHVKIKEESKKATANTDDQDSMFYYIAKTLSVLEYALPFTKYFL